MLIILPIWIAAVVSPREYLEVRREFKANGISVANSHHYNALGSRFTFLVLGVTVGFVLLTLITYGGWNRLLAAFGLSLLEFQKMESVEVVLLATLNRKRYL